MSLEIIIGKNKTGKTKYLENKYKKEVFENLGFCKIISWFFYQINCIKLKLFIFIIFLEFALVQALIVSLNTRTHTGAHPWIGQRKNH